MAQNINVYRSIGECVKGSITDSARAGSVNLHIPLLRTF